MELWADRHFKKIKFNLNLYSAGGSWQMEAAGGNKWSYGQRGDSVLAVLECQDEPHGGLVGDPGGRRGSGHRGSYPLDDSAGVSSGS